ncbi:MAG: dipeptide ABC transporter ATP-binding protein [Rhodobiaceae bacterium]|nr:dipeptide ABC transporter ATP-binding protein [Rhodobiaceae bacterium]
MSEGPVIVGRNLEKHYTVGGGFMREPQVVKALRGVSFSLSAGKTLAVVGESGCGKSTLARLITMIEEPTGGTIEIDGWNVTSTGEEGRKAFRTHVQIVFQDPYGSLNPRQKVGSMLEEPLLINTKDNAAERQDKAREMLRLVGLRPEHYDRYPHMFSGGQRQRIAIARALMLNPKILVLDEPVSALDVSIQAQILNLLAKLQEKLQLAYIFISHNLSVVRHVADDVLVMYLGRTVEAASRDELFEYPRHPYTRALLSATPVADPARVKQRIRLEGELPSPINPPPGCAFNPRCPLVIEKCTRDMPELESHGEAQVACYRAGEKISGSSGR